MSKEGKEIIIIAVQLIRVTDPKSLTAFISALRSGKTVIFPTDTVYGLGCLLTWEAAIKKIVRIKGRKPGKPFPLLVSDLALAEKIAYFTKKIRMVAKDFWPGPVTMVLKAKTSLSPLVSQEGKVALRIPDSPFLRKAIKRIGTPLIGTSANLSGEKPAARVSEIRPKLLEQVDLVIDGGETSGKPSTIYDFTGNHPILIRE